MDIDESLLNLGSILVELGLPILLVYLYKFYPNRRPALVTTLFSIVPFLCFYLYCIAATIFDSTISNQWSLGAMWVMSFFLYAATAIVGFLFGCLVPKNTRFWKLALLGLFCGPLVLFILNFLPM